MSELMIVGSLFLYMLPFCTKYSSTCFILDFECTRLTATMEQTQVSLFVAQLYQLNTLVRRVHSCNLFFRSFVRLFIVH